MSAGTAVVECVRTCEEPSERSDWNPFTRIVFRFSFLYFGLFFLTIPQPTNVFLGWLLEYLPPNAIEWQIHVLDTPLRAVGSTMFGVDISYQGSHSGDQRIFWVQLFCLMIIAAVGTLIWSIVSRRGEHRRWAGWLLMFIRWCVAGQMLWFGLGKLIPAQMPEPALATLLEPYGNLTPMSVLWNQVGGSPTYQMLLGAAEVLGGIMLFIPRTALPGAMLSLIAMAQVFVLDVNFDVPVKILSGHLMLAALVLLAPEAHRLVSMLVLNRTTPPSTAPYPFHTRRSRLVGGAVQILLGIWVGVYAAHISWAQLQQEGPDRVKPPLYGIWNVQEFIRDDQAVPPLLTDRSRWQRVVFDVPEIMEFQRMDGSFGPARAQVDTAARRLELKTATEAAPFRPTPRPMPEVSGSFSYDQPAADRLRLAGELDGHHVEITFTRLDPDTLPQRSHPFSWVMDYANF
ncbi:hypothetical protein DFR76_107370 [Nocardia pseudobrasiliensis]|uniref:DoxX family protein n=2 Tax=Nocardia pseudobrasiliensis TaxID=45979 RepID=A0A370I2M6_9NOCA|nr:hypothetical protein DFR76_107370 [Nocardia pseudobrasiliensis]